MLIATLNDNNLESFDIGMEGAHPGGLELVPLFLILSFFLFLKIKPLILY